MRHGMRMVLAAAGVTLLGLALPTGEAAAESAEADIFYEVIDGKVDKGTFNGYRRYHASCHTCHGPDGMGSSYAPSMIDSLKTMDYVAFTEVVVNGRENVTGTQQNVMPAFGEVNDVMLYIDDIFAYLQARTDGVIPRGRPERHDR